MSTVTAQATLRAERAARFQAAAASAISHAAALTPVARTAQPPSRQPLDIQAAMVEVTENPTADHDRRTHRYLVSQALRLGSLVAAATLPLPLLARLALVVGCMVLSFGAVMGGDAESARRRRQELAVRAVAEHRRLDTTAVADVEAPAGGSPRREGLGYRLRWRMSYGLLTAYGPAQLSGNDDPREQMRTERAARRAAAVSR